MRKTGAALTLVAMGLAFALTPWDNAEAQSPAPCTGAPGERQVGTHPGGNGIAPTPLCVSDGSSSSSQPESQWGTASVRQAYNDFIALPRSPENAWFHYPPENDVCSAIFNGSGEYVIIRLPLTAAENRAPSLTFWSRNVPRSLGQKVRAVDAVFENGVPGGKTITQAVKAIFDPEKGQYILTLPSNAVALRAIDDRMAFRLSVSGSTVVDLNWVNGNQAKATLAKCLGE